MGGVVWTEHEDQLLKKCIERYGEGTWHRVPLLAGLNRCRKSCRLRWLNYLRSNIKRGSFAEDEVHLIIKLHKLLGNKRSLIAGRPPGRTANDVKNYWNCHLSKKLSAQETEEEYQSAMNVEALTVPQPRSNSMTGSTKPRTHDHVAPKKNRLRIEESSMSTPFNFVDESKQGPAGGVFVGDLAREDHLFGKFDEVNVLGGTDHLHHEGCSKWDWDDLILDMYLWTDSL